MHRCKQHDGTYCAAGSMYILSKHAVLYYTLRNSHVVTIFQIKNSCAGFGCWRRDLLLTAV